MTHKNKIVSGLLLTCALSSFSAQAEWTANAAVSNNYIWRGLTQSTNEPAVSGGIDYAHESGFYAGTWASNVQYASDDNFSYEHDVYFGYAGEVSGISYDVGYLYYNYDSAANFDFGEIYATVGYENFSVTGYLLANTEADETSDNQDFDFGSTFYLSADYTYEIKEGLELGFHIGFQDGDFSEAFNGVPNGYFDYNVSLAKDGFSFTVTSTDLDDIGDDDGLDNDSVKFVVGYAVDFAL